MRTIEEIQAKLRWLDETKRAGYNYVFEENRLSLVDIVSYSRELERQLQRLMQSTEPKPIEPFFIGSGPC